MEFLFLSILRFNRGLFMVFDFKGYTNCKTNGPQNQSHGNCYYFTMYIGLYYILSF